jgi:PPOX class probable F420-dependent enzyme
MRTPEDDWWIEFLSADPARPGVLAVVRRDGRPHASPVWYAVDTETGTGEPDLVFTTNVKSIKAKAIDRDGRVCLLVDDDRPPFSFVQVTGTATLSDDLAEVRRWATLLGGRYMGPDRAEEYGNRNGVPGELLVRLRPDSVVAGRDIAKATGE